MEDTRRKTTSVRQLELLLTFMEGHTNFAVGQVRSKEGRAVSARLWEQCAEILNAEGVTRTSKDWSKFWNDYKCRVRAKLSEINRGFRATGGGPSRAPQLTPLEERVATLLGRDVGPLTGVRQDPEITIEYLNNTEEMEVEQDVTLPASNSPILDLNFTQEISGAQGNMSLADLSRTATLETQPSTTESQQRNRTVSLETPTISTESQQRNRTVTLETPPISTVSQQRDAHVEAVVQPARQGSTPPRTGRPRNRQPRQTRPREGGARPRVHQSNTAALDEARATIARIEEMRARTDATMATAALNISTALTSMADSLRIYLSRNE